jgi:hypothetical protein
LDQVELCGRVREFLTPVQAYSINVNCHETNLRRYHNGTCGWLNDDSHYKSWLDPSFESPDERIFCLSGPAGYGKSILSSFIIQDIQDRHDAALAYYFCQFSQPCENVQELLRILAVQLFNVYFARRLPVDDELCHKVLCSTSESQILDLIGELCINLCPVYFIIDGLDEAQEERSQRAISSVLSFICDKIPGDVRLWITKRRQARTVESYDTIIRPRPHTQFEMTDHTEADVVRYIVARIGALEKRLGPSKDDKQLFRVAENYLMARARGNFLWARLMTQDFEGEDRIEDATELLHRVFGPPPGQLDALYRTLFDRIKPENRKIAR